MEAIINVPKDAKSSSQILQIRFADGLFLFRVLNVCPMRRWKWGTHGNGTISERSGSRWKNYKLPFNKFRRLLWSWAHKMSF
ncbi:Hypothetical protein FKW44_009311 [Caligus rogercresseyi]|uniref:Uncharacterized protein n=1 Tax=Caligus rogercresseyi TaxID=217165 RepID=A0A7T8HFF3_CALRO|nr:Hypothetical protein FKW44_009311 [Caligus rogercresseyi]